MREVLLAWWGMTGCLDTQIEERVEKKEKVSLLCDVGLCGGTNGVPRLTTPTSVTSPTLP